MEKQINDFDILKMYFGEPYHITDKITILQPTIGDILEFGEQRFYSIVSTLCTNTTSFRLQLWEMGIDWNTISDFTLFSWLIKSLNADDTRLLFGDLNFSWLEQYIDRQTNQMVLVYIPRDENGNQMEVSFEDIIKIDEALYSKIVEYLRTMFDIHPKVEMAYTKESKELIIEEEKMNLDFEKKNKNKSNKSFLFPLVSAMLNHSGFKYKKNELKEVGIVEFMDSVKRIQTYESVTSLMGGMYSGFLDTSKLDLNKELNWMRNIYEASK